MIKKGFLLAGCMLCCVARADFVPGTEDIPAMDDMVFAEDIVSFDVPEGQILAALATTKASDESIYRFYQSSMLALGWQQSSKGVFTRGKDRLEINVVHGIKEQQVRFNLSIFNN